jgi:hypothetical protein
MLGTKWKISCAIGEMFKNAELSKRLISLCFYQYNLDEAAALSRKLDVFY